MSFSVTLLYDNTSMHPDCIADWGFSCLVEGDGLPTVLFDTGADDAILLHNMDALHRSPKEVDMVVISHPHFDHIGGLAGFLRANSDVELYVPYSFRGVRRATRVEHLNVPKSITPRVHVTGELDGKEMFLLIQTDVTRCLVSGCLHVPLEQILACDDRFSNPTDFVGGLHHYRDFTVLGKLNSVCPTHCSKFGEEFKLQHPLAFLQGGVGQVFKYE